VGHFTLDNASNNATMMEELGKLLHVRDIPFDGCDRKIMCFAHVINICCQHVIGEFTNIELSESVDDFVAEELACHPDHQTFEDAVKRDPVTLGRNIMRVLRSSSSRRDAFDQHIRDGNEKGWFDVGQLQLLRDVKMRWDSVYYMLRRLRELQPVCCYYVF
jgi:hypothetical protein